MPLVVVIAYDNQWPFSFTFVKRDTICDTEANKKAENECIWAGSQS